MNQKKKKWVNLKTAMETVRKETEGSKQVTTGKEREGKEKEGKRRYCRQYNTCISKIFDNKSIKDGRREISEYYCKVFHIIYEMI